MRQRSEISLLDFKVMVTKMFTKLGRRLSEYSENITKRWII